MWYALNASAKVGVHCSKMSFIRKQTIRHNKAKTLVWWDIDSCPVPDGYDAGLVRLSIASALKKAGYSGSLTITTLGDLKRTFILRPDVLPAISSTGIHLKHLRHGLGIFEDLVNWTRDNSPPANLIFISNNVDSYTAALFSLKDATDLQENCSEMGESPGNFLCKPCKFSCRSFEDFNRHFVSTYHALRDFGRVAPPVRRNIMWSTEGVEEEWDRKSL